MNLNRSLKAALIRPLIFLLLLTPTMVGCSSYQHRLTESRRLMEQRQEDQALEKIKPFALTPGDDQLVYLLDYATALQAKGLYEVSNKVLLQAEEIAEIKDYHSVSRIAGSLMLSQGMVQYKGENYEKTLINAMLAVNFLALGNFEAAQVETRKLNEMLYRLRKEAKKKYPDNGFAYYLSGFIWEQDRKWDDAFIDYKKAYELNPSLKYIKQDLLRVSYLSRRMDALKKYKKEFKYKKSNASLVPSKKQGELLIVLGLGWAPRKYPGKNSHRLPWIYPVNTSLTHFKAVIDDKVIEVSDVGLDVEASAMITFKEDYDDMVAMRVAGIAAKAVVSDQIRQNNEGLGNLAWLVMNVADQADLRQWSTLPKQFHVIRKRLPAGKHKLKLLAMSGASVMDQAPEEIEFVIKPRKSKVLFWRAY